MSKGLPSRFNLSKGKFVLTDGVEKSRDNIWFYCTFDKFRVYASDFGANFVSLIQRPASYLLLNRTLIVGSLRNGIQKYVPNVKVEDIDIGYTVSNRTQAVLAISYTTVQENKTVVQDVTFI